MVEKYFEGIGLLATSCWLVALSAGGTSLLWQSGPGAKKQHQWSLALLVRWQQRAGHVFMVAAIRNPCEEKPWKGWLQGLIAYVNRSRASLKCLVNGKGNAESSQGSDGAGALRLLRERGELGVQVPDPSCHFPQVSACQHPISQGYLSFCLLLRALGSKRAELLHTCHINQ